VTVHFIGAGPGAPDLLTLRARALIERCPVCLYAGALVPREIVALAPRDALLVDTAPLSLPQILAHLEAAHGQGRDVARLHSGDPSIYSALAEQAAALAARGIPYEIVPGVPAFAAAAAALGTELTLPGVAQTLVLTRLGGRASRMPSGEELEAYAASGATLAIHLAAARLDEIVQRLSPVLGADCPAAVVARASWPDEAAVRATLGTLVEAAAPLGLSRTAMVLVGRALAAGGGRSALYDEGHDRLFKPAR